MPHPRCTLAPITAAGSISPTCKAFLWPNARVRNSLLLNHSPGRDPRGCTGAHTTRPSHTHIKTRCGVPAKGSADHTSWPSDPIHRASHSKQRTNETLHSFFDKSSGKGGLWCLSSQATIMRAEALLPRDWLDICLQMGSHE